MDEPASLGDPSHHFSPHFSPVSLALVLTGMLGPWVLAWLTPGLQVSTKISFPRTSLTLSTSNRFPSAFFPLYTALTSGRYFLFMCEVLFYFPPPPFFLPLENVKSRRICLPHSIFRSQDRSRAARATVCQGHQGRNSFFGREVTFYRFYITHSFLQPKSTPCLFALLEKQKYFLRF